MGSRIDARPNNIPRLRPRIGGDSFSRTLRWRTIILKPHEGHHMDAIKVLAVAEHRNARSPETKWKFFQGFMIGGAPVMIAPPLWLSKTPRA
jgi:hypothetical protein